jgi:hypothetical protein
MGLKWARDASLISNVNEHNSPATKGPSLKMPDVCRGIMLGDLPREGLKLFPIS